MINYIVFSYTDGEHVGTKRVKALNVQHVHEKAATWEGKFDRVAVYPDFMKGGEYDVYLSYVTAFQMVNAMFKSIVKNGKPIERIHTETQRIISRECRVMVARLGTEECQKEGQKYINEHLDNMNHDTQDIVEKCVAELYEGYTEGLTDYDELLRHVYKQMNRYVSGERRHEENNTHMEEIEIDGGTIVPINKYIARIIKGGERYTPAETGELEPETVKLLGKTLAEASTQLTERQKEILRLVYFKHSMCDICNKLDVKSEGTVSDHIARYRKIYADYIHTNAPELDKLVDLAAANKTFESRAKDRHTAEGKERKKASDRATQAARAKAYRERKKLEKLMKHGHEMNLDTKGGLLSYINEIQSASHIFKFEE